MAEKQEMEITIGKDGEVQIHVQGVDGKSCMELTKDLEEALGVVTTREKTGDYFKKEKVQENRISLEDKE
jgi:acylphosphatase